MARLPESIDKYRVESLIASGGMGQVYKAEHPTLKRPVIIKKLSLGSTATLTERFRREARILMDFRNDHIVDVHDHFVKGRSNYIVMEFVDGISVKDLLETQRYIDNASAAYIALYTARALSYAHGKSVIHRDIKPGNILISRDGDIKLADFGIASSRESSDETLTSEGMTLGTPSYMAPEQFRNSREVDYRADLYSLGVMLYEMLTGRKPYGGGFSPELIQQIQKGKYPRPRKLNPAISRPLERIIRKLIRPNERRRVKDARQLEKRLERFLRQYYPDQIRNRLAAFVQGRDLPHLTVRKQQPGIIRTIGIAGGVLVLGGGISLALLTNMHNRVLFPSNYGQVRFVLENADTAGERSGSELYPESSIFQDDDEQIPRLPQRIIYRENDTGGGKSFSSLPLVLPKGRYRLKTTVNGQVIWKSFYLPPWNNRKEELRIFSAPLAPAPRPVRVETIARNALTGRNLDGLARFTLVRGGRELPLDDARLLSGDVRHFRVNAPGYLSQDFVLRLDVAQDRLTLAADLIPVPSQLSIELRGEGAYRIRINGSSRISTIDDGAVVKSDIVPESREEYAVLPGRYLLEASGADSEGNSWEEALSLELESGADIRVEIDTESGRIRLLR
ncbi:serine/threonine-protein kinase [Salinispira pacifica]|uniref:Serine/threonine protein kinase n=1 Tax=Salinispira pacifica TaxID=1307761 RepID=V5WKV6_9SPIO|nr:serine/threonine-protein kinase [Salinispira pacifica]AHC16383.1 serine/threonine protein kinase [Salinispira pacifica]